MHIFFRLSKFARADANHDGKLTPDEIRTMARRQGMPSGGAEGAKRLAGIFRNAPLHNAVDTTHNSVISADEIAAAGQSLLALDLNHDGEITPDEMKPRQQTPEERADHMLDEWDTNKDGNFKVRSPRPHAADL